MLIVMLLVFAGVAALLTYILENNNLSKGEGFVGLANGMAILAALVILIAECIVVLNVIVSKPAKIEYEKAACQVEIVEANKVLKAKVKEYEKWNQKTYETVDSDTLLKLYPELAHDKDIYDTVEHIHECEQNIKDFDYALEVTVPMMRFLAYFGH